MFHKTKLLALLLYATSMGFLEAAVAIYLRALYYPQGFAVATPVELSPLIYRVDLFREAATIVMLLTVGYLAFTKIKDKIWAFFWLFAVWDLSYYFFLKLILNWPISLKTLDVLFLIPIPWIAPVWLPLSLFSVVLIITTYHFLTKRPS